MQACFRNAPAKNRPPAGRLIGSTSNILLLGFLAGVFAGYSMPAATMDWLAPLTLFGFAFSVIFTMTKAILANRSQQKAFEIAMVELERRMERLIPKRRDIAHRADSHRPHKWEDAEIERMLARHKRSKRSTPR